MRRVLEIESETKNIEKLRKFLKDIFVECGLEIRHFNKVFLGVSEAVCNSIIHGNQFVKDKVVTIVVSCEKGRLSIVVKDEGQGFDHKVLEDPTVAHNIKKESGRGIFLLKSVSDDLIFDRGGTQVSIKFNLNE